MLQSQETYMNVDGYPITGAAFIAVKKYRSFSAVSFALVPKPQMF